MFINNLQSRITRRNVLKNKNSEKRYSETALTIKVTVKNRSSLMIQVTMQRKHLYYTR